VSFAPRFHAMPTSMLGIGSNTDIASSRSPSSDHGRYTMSERIVTPAPVATRLRIASIDEVRNVTFGAEPYWRQ
jgi:hypothetical protein